MPDPVEGVRLGLGRFTLFFVKMRPEKY
ncbi:hypothetical protein BRAO375_710006 [Bradyrhizobium sp. ORS 375]|nr:hypothetical protein BRAO375_710006 [Bradyrhizobium sp. ORS 375]